MPYDIDSQRLRHVLVATDFSEAAANGVAWAASLARRHGARLTLVHVLAPAVPVGEFAVPPPPEAYEEIEAAAREGLAAALAAAPVEGLETAVRLATGATAPEVAEIAAEEKADLVVTGTRGRTGLAHLLLGSTAERIVQQVAGPVLAVHPGDHPPAGGPRSVLVPTDFSDDADGALAAAACILAPATGDATDARRLFLLHVYEGQASFLAYGAASAPYRYSDEVAAVVTERLEEMAAPWRRRGFTVEVLTRTGIPSEIIARTAGEVEAELVAMGTHGRSGLAHLFLGSTADRVVQHAPCPVLTVRRRG